MGVEQAVAAMSSGFWEDDVSASLRGKAGNGAGVVRAVVGLERFGLETTPLEVRCK